MLHPKKKTHLVLVPSTVLAFLGRTFLVKYTEANRIHLILSRVLEDKSGILSTQSSTWTTPRGSRGSPLTISVLKGDDDDDAVQISETSWGTSGSNAQARFFFSISQPCWRHTGGGSCCSCVSTTAGRRGPRWGEGSFSEESPSDISEVASVSEDDNVDLAVEHGRDGEGLSFTGLQGHTTGVTIASERVTKGNVIFDCCCWFPTFTVSCCLGLRLSGIVMVNFSFPLSCRESAFCSGRNWSGMMPMPTSWFLCSFSKLSAMTARTPCRRGRHERQTRNKRLRSTSG